MEIWGGRIEELIAPPLLHTTIAKFIVGTQFLHAKTRAVPAGLARSSEDDAEAGV